MEVTFRNLYPTGTYAVHEYSYLSAFFMRKMFNFTSD